MQRAHTHTRKNENNKDNHAHTQNTHEQTNAQYARAHNKETLVHTQTHANPRKQHCNNTDARIVTREPTTATHQTHASVHARRGAWSLQAQSPMLPAFLSPHPQAQELPVCLSKSVLPSCEELFPVTKVSGMV
jgi:hypothetical protein